jgi:hypothetical protein
VAIYIQGRRKQELPTQQSSGSALLGASWRCLDPRRARGKWVTVGGPLPERAKCHQISKAYYRPILKYFPASDGWVKTELEGSLNRQKEESRWATRRKRQISSNTISTHSKTESCATLRSCLASPRNGDLSNVYREIEAIVSVWVT